MLSDAFALAVSDGVPLSRFLNLSLVVPARSDPPSAGLPVREHHEELYQRAAWAALVGPLRTLGAVMDGETCRSDLQLFGSMLADHMADADDVLTEGSAAESWPRRLTRTHVLELYAAMKTADFESVAAEALVEYLTDARRLSPDVRGGLMRLVAATSARDDVMTRLRGWYEAQLDAAERERALYGLAFDWRTADALQYALTGKVRCHPACCTGRHTLRSLPPLQFVLQLLGLLCSSSSLLHRSLLCKPPDCCTAVCPATPQFAASQSALQLHSLLCDGGRTLQVDAQDLTGFVATIASQSVGAASMAWAYITARTAAFEALFGGPPDDAARSVDMMLARVAAHFTDASRVEAVWSFFEHRVGAAGFAGGRAPAFVGAAIAAIERNAAIHTTLVSQACTWLWELWGSGWISGDYDLDDYVSARRREEAYAEYGEYEYLEEVVRVPEGTEPYVPAGGGYYEGKEYAGSAYGAAEDGAGYYDAPVAPSEYYARYGDEEDTYDGSTWPFGR